MTVNNIGIILFDLFLKFVVLFIGHRFKPFVRSILPGNFESKVGKPTIGSGTMPMLYIRRNVNNRTRKYLYCRFTLFLIPALSGYTNKHLPPSFRGFVNMPIVTATWFERNIGNIYLFL